MRATTVLKESSHDRGALIAQLRVVAYVERLIQLPQATTGIFLALDGIGLVAGWRERGPRAGAAT